MENNWHAMYTSMDGNENTLIKSNSSLLDDDSTYLRFMPMTHACTGRENGMNGQLPYTRELMFTPLPPHPTPGDLYMNVPSAFQVS